MLIILCGKSGCGKDTAEKYLKDNCSYIPIVSYTTRPMRDGETEGIEYHFCNNKEFKYMIDHDKLIEYREYHTLVNGKKDVWYYGNVKEQLDIDKNYITILDIQGTKDFLEYYGKDYCKVVYIDVDEEVRKERAIKRGSFDETEWNRRAKDDNENLSLDDNMDLFDLVVYQSDNGSDIYRVGKLINDWAKKGFDIDGD